MSETVPETLPDPVIPPPEPPAPPRFFAVVNAEGRALGFYRSDFHPRIPEGAVEITEEVHYAWCADTLRQRWDGQRLVPCEPPPPPLTAEQARRRRDMLLRESDWTQIPDVTLTPEQRQAWRAYRQALRDVPQQPGFPERVAWPTPPSP